MHIGWRHLGPSTLQRAHSAVHSIVANAAYCQERQFDRLSKTNTVETLLSNLDADALQKCAQIVKFANSAYMAAAMPWHCLRSDYSSASKPTECSMRCATDSRRLQPL